MGDAELWGPGTAGHGVTQVLGYMGVTQWGHTGGQGGTHKASLGRAGVPTSHGAPHVSQCHSLCWARGLGGMLTL